MASNSAAYAASFMTRFDSRRPAAWAAANSFAVPDVAVLSLRPWKLSVIPIICRASSYTCARYVKSCEILPCISLTEISCALPAFPGRITFMSSASARIEASSGRTMYEPDFTSFSTILDSIRLHVFCWSRTLSTSESPKNSPNSETFFCNIIG